MDKLEKNGYMVRQLGAKGEKPDSYIGTDKLFKILNDSAEIEECIPYESIILRKNDNGKKSDIDYVDTALTMKLSEEVKLINNVRAKNKVSLKNVPADLLKDGNALYFAEKIERKDKKTNIDLRTTYLVRIFNDNFLHGGRFYRGVESNMPKAIRKYLMINGNETVELDYKALHLNMLYHKEGIKPKTDPYDDLCKRMPKLRSIFKLLALTCLNSVDEKKCIQAFREELKTGGLQSLLPDLTDRTLKPMLELFKDKHKKIAKYFFTGIGLELQNMDAEIAHEILLHFAKKGIMVLVVHDSFIIEKQHENELKLVMRKIYKEKLRFSPDITIS
ncbi:MAG TPA: hypothetical protein VHP32_06665 [Ignavibacteria bacterium]|nr:hypothetical protein [Ignavibacteria bacterium]